MKVIAKKNNIFGWVRNLPDKRGEAKLEGIVNLVIWLLNGPELVLQIHMWMVLKLIMKNLKMNFQRLKFCTNFLRFNTVVVLLVLD